MPHGKFNNRSFQVFIAVSYGAACRGRHESGYRETLESIVSDMERRGLRVYLAPREEQWGAMRPERSVGIKRDFKALGEADIFVLFLDGNDSDGALVELGIAVSLGMYTIVIARYKESVRGYLEGVLDLGLAEIFYLVEEDTSLLAIKVEEVLSSQALRRSNYHGKRL